MKYRAAVIACLAIALSSAASLAGMKTTKSVTAFFCEDEETVVLFYMTRHNQLTGANPWSLLLGITSEVEQPLDCSYITLVGKIKSRVVDTIPTPNGHMKIIEYAINGKKYVTWLFNGHQQVPRTV
jgi:hypothetical protein